jgi:hypothetical protein
MPMPREHTVHTVNDRGEVEYFQRESDSAPDVQRLLISDWHPTMSPNGSHNSWFVHQAKHDRDQRKGLLAAIDADWRYVEGKVRLDIVLIYPRLYHTDADNLAARCKGLIDGLKLRKGRGFFRDDSIEWLDLHVTAEVRKSVKATAITLSRVTATALPDYQPSLIGGRK